MTMTPQQVIDAARQRYNAVSDTFWSDEELLMHVQEACGVLARESLCIEHLATTTSTAGTQGYSYPTRAISVRRVDYDGKRLDPITMREDDRLTFFDSATTSRGEPQYYFIWDDTIYLRPIPDTSSLTIRIFCYLEPDTVTAGSTLEVPSLWQTKLIDFVVSRMALKEKNFATYKEFDNHWQRTIIDAKAWAKKRRRGDAFAAVQDETSYIEVPGRV